MTDRVPDDGPRPDLPELSEPVMIVAFEGGWNDAGEAASTALEHLELSWDATPLDSIDPEDYYDFQVTRPLVHLADGGVSRRVEWQTTRLSVAKLPGTDRHVVLVNGIEPNLRWRSFCGELLDYVDVLGVTKVISLGGAMQTETPHTRPTPVTGFSWDRDSAGELQVEPSSYQGPTGIVGVFHQACVEAGVPRDVVLGVGAALRVAGPGAQGCGGAAAPRRGGPRRRGAARWAAGTGRGVGAHGLGDGRGR